MNKTNKMITGDEPVNAIVLNDYRTAEILLQFGIDFCCGGVLPLKAVCEAKGLSTEKVIGDLQNASRTITLPHDLPFSQWSLPFLVDFIVNVHHVYLKKAIPVAKIYTGRLANSHQKKYPGLGPLKQTIENMEAESTPYLQRKEEIFFPYIKQLARAHSHKEPYAGLLVRTLRKPLQSEMQQAHLELQKKLSLMREFTNDYTLPSNACITHRTTYFKLRELDNELLQHIYLERDLLLPGAVRLEQELLSSENGAAL